MRKGLFFAFAMLGASAYAQAPSGFQVVEGGVLDLCVSNTSSSYKAYATPLYIAADAPLTVYTSRYTELNCKLAGEGDLLLYCGGERTFIGDQKGSNYPDWTKYTGDIHVYPWTEVEQKAGFYGVILNHGGKRFNPEDMAASMASSNSQLINNRLYIHDGATLAMPTGIRGVRIGELNTEAGSRIFGSIKKSSSTTPSACYVVVGASGTDAVLAGVIRSVDDAGTPLGIIKEGAGAYRITGNDNVINGAVRVLEGSVMVNNDAAAAQAGKLQGGIGAVPGGAPGVYVFKGGCLGGTGSIGSVVDAYGDIAPGDNGIGTLALADYAGGSPVALRLRPSSRLHFEIKSANEHDALTATGCAEYYNIGQDFQTSDKMPIVCIEPVEGDELQAGDEIVLITAAGKSALGGGDWAFRVQYPKKYSWQVEERLADGRYELVARVLSLAYEGQGDAVIDDENPGVEPEDDGYDDGYDEKADKASLRQYADKAGKMMGVAVSTWRISGFDSDNTPEIKQIYTEFNTLVAENEMKWDATEPSRGSFSYADGDRIASLAGRHGMSLRGHALAWHKQMPAWLSSDGGVKNNNNFSREELLGILERHITAVVGHYKGKVKEWDVVNECLSDDQSAIRSNPDAYDLRPSVWYNGIGEEFIDSAFVYAHRADPDALLILNDYGAEFKGSAKTEAMYNLAKRLVRDGIPIHGVGLQCHLDAGSVDAKALEANVAAYEALGLTCVITELDLGAESDSSYWLERQAKDYYAIASVAAGHPNCRGLVVWGFSDDQSWRSSSPLLFNSAHSPKPAYYGVRKALRHAVGELGVFDPAYEPAVVGSEYYDIQGRRVFNPTSGVAIRVDRLADGAIRANKVIISEQ